MPFLTNICSGSRFPMHFLLTCRRLQSLSNINHHNHYQYFSFLTTADCTMLSLQLNEKHFWPQSHIIRTYSKFSVTIMTGRHLGNIFVLSSSHGGHQGGHWGPKITFLAPKRAILGNGGQKMARRAAERAPTGGLGSIFFRI